MSHPIRIALIAALCLLSSTASAQSCGLLHACMSPPSIKPGGLTQEFMTWRDFAAQNSAMTFAVDTTVRFTALNEITQRIRTFRAGESARCIAAAFGGYAGQSWQPHRCERQVLPEPGRPWVMARRGRPGRLQAVACAA